MPWAEGWAIILALPAADDDVSQIITCWSTDLQAIMHRSLRRASHKRPIHLFVLWRCFCTNWPPSTSTRNQSFHTSLQTVSRDPGPSWPCDGVSESKGVNNEPGHKVAWLSDYKGLIDQAYDAVVKLLTFDWMVPDETGDRRFRELTRARQIYVPELILRQHIMLYASQEYVPE